MTRPFYGVQFHPEVTHTPRGEQIFHNFLYDICQCTGSWTMGNFVEADRRAKSASKSATRKVICGLSGGVDSSVVAALLHKAIGKQLVCIFVDNGLLRKNERHLVESTFRDHFKIDLRVHDASEHFLTRTERRHRSAAEAKDHRQGVHRRVQPRGEDDRTARNSSRRARSIPT